MEHEWIIWWVFSIFTEEEAKEVPGEACPPEPG